MLLRKESQSVVAIPQVSHAWICGQLARSWGNEKFAPPLPRELLCLAAEQHDIGWLDYDLTPDFDVKTGLPQEFYQLPEATHTSLWRDGVNHARAFGRFVSLLVSLHADTVYSRHFNFEKASVETAALVRRFLDDQRALQMDFIASLQSDPDFAGLATKETIEHDRLLIAALDAMSLSICWGVTQPMRVKTVPVNALETTDIILSRGSTAGEIIVEPWPFASSQLELEAEGRRLHGPYADAGELHEAFEMAQSALVRATLRPA
jgi:Protein of unknown function (DUF3891)